ncbi:MAG: TIGR00725 family protein [Chloroflexaceae bacterium]|nr:TIGR00725 family protein [Chloroflexaceae bacterium]
MAVCGAGTCDTNLAAMAYRVGYRIADVGALLVCGGLGGVMEAACHGATDAGGMTLGLLPGPDSTSANPFVHIAVPTGLGHARNVLIVQTAQVVIAIGGAYGTLSEIALARKCNRRVIGLHTWDIGHDEQGRPHVIAADQPEEAVRLAQQHIT